MEAEIIDKIWNIYMWPKIQENMPLFLLAVLIIGSIAWRRPNLGALVFTLSLTVWVADIFLEQIKVSSPGVPGVFLTFILLALIVNGVLLFRTMTN